MTATSEPRGATSERASLGAAPSDLSRPARNFCIDCRTALGQQDRCDGGRAHRVVDLNADAGRAALLAEVWGPPDLRRRARQVAKAGGAGAAVDSCANLGGCDGCVDLGSGGLGDLAALLLGLLLAALVFIALWFVISKIIEAVRRYRAKLVPKGALSPAPRPHGGMRTGVVRSDANGVTADGHLVARAIELHKARLSANDVMLREAMTDGMIVALGDGATVKVPAGRLRLAGSWHVHDDPLVGVDALSRATGPVSEDEDGYALVPYDVTMCLELRVGDRVAIHGPLELDAPRGASGGYRGASTALVCVGTPSLSRIDG
jgi:hypothetical protein